MILLKKDKGLTKVNIILIIVAIVAVVVAGSIGGYFIYKNHSNGSNNESSDIGDSIFDLFSNDGNPKWKEVHFADSSKDAIAFAIDENNDLWRWDAKTKGETNVPTKISSDVSYYSIGDDKWEGFSSWNSIINTKGELLYWSDSGDTALITESDPTQTINYGGKQISAHKKCDNAKKAEIKNNACMFLNNSGELYMWGKYYSHFTDIINDMSQPVLISENVKDFSLTTQGFAWVLDNNGKLWAFFCGKNDMGTTIDIMDNVKTLSVRPEACCVVDNKGDVYIVPNSRDQKRIITLYEYNEIKRNSKSNIISALPESAYVFASADAYDKYSSSYNKPLDCKSDIFSLEAPLKVSENAVDAVLGLNHVLILKEDNTLWGWGFNEYGQLGIGGFDYSIHKETLIMEDVKCIGAGMLWSAAITQHGKLYTWGSNQLGMLGQGHSQYRVMRPRRVDINVNSEELDKQLKNMDWAEQDYVDYYIQTVTPSYLFNGDKYQVDIIHNPVDSKTGSNGLNTDNCISIRVVSEEDEAYGNRLPYMYIDLQSNTNLETKKELDWRYIDFISRIK